MKKPDIVILRKTDTEGKFLVKLYGIEFEVYEGKSDGFKPLSEIAEEIGISLERLCDKLKQKSLLDSENNISQEECWVEGIDGVNICKDKYAYLVLVHMHEMTESYSFNSDDLIDKVIYGHVGFIKDLLDPLIWSVKKISPKSGDIVIIDGHIPKSATLNLSDYGKDNGVTFMITHGTDINIADEKKMEELGWYRKDAV
jgi:hypothetical protein